MAAINTDVPEVQLMDTGVGLILGAGAMTFGNEWMQTGGLNWRVPIAITLIAGLDGALSALSPTAGIAFGAIIFIGALTVPLNGKSPIQELNTQLSPAKKGK
jgi:hypothetical protein